MVAVSPQCRGSSVQVEQTELRLLFEVCRRKSADRHWDQPRRTGGTPVV